MGRIEPKPIVDLAAIYERLPDTNVCVKLPLRMAIALSVAGQQLRWETRRIMPDSIPADTVSADIEQALAALGAPVDCDSSLPFDPTDHDSIAQWIVESEDILITINNNVCCDCGGTSGQVVIPTGPIVPDGYIPPLTASDTETPNIENGGYLQAKCNAVHYSLYAYRLACLNWIQNLSSFTDFSDWWGVIFGPTSGPLASPIGAAEYWQLLALANGYSSQTEQFTTVYDTAYNTLACELYGAATAQAGQQLGYTALSGVYASLPDGVRYALLYIWSLMPLDDVYQDPESLTMPASHEERDCTECGGPPVPTGVTVSLNDALGSEAINWSPGDEVYTNRVYQCQGQFESSTQGDYDLLWLTFSQPINITVDVSGWQSGSSVDGLWLGSNTVLIDAAPDGVYVLESVGSLRLNGGLAGANRLDFWVTP